MTHSESSSPTPLPLRPSLQLLANLAKQLRKGHSNKDAAAIERFRLHHPRFAVVAGRTNRPRLRSRYAMPSL